MKVTSQPRERFFEHRQAYSAGERGFGNGVG